MKYQADELDHLYSILIYRISMYVCYVEVLTWELYSQKNKFLEWKSKTDHFFLGWRVWCGDYE